MTEYVVKIRFWLRAYDSRIITAATDTEACHMAKAAAREMMADRTQPEDIDLEDRHDGLISYIDRLDDGRSELIEAVVFDGNRPRDPDVRSVIARLAALDDSLDPSAAIDVLREIIGAARALPSDHTSMPPDASRTRDRRSVDAACTYSGDPRTFSVHVADEAGVVQALDPRLDLRNHSPTGFAWGYRGSGPAQLALAILCHALRSDERAKQLYQDFKHAVIAPLDREKPWRLTTRDVLGWVVHHPTTSVIANSD